MTVRPDPRPHAPHAPRDPVDALGQPLAGPDLTPRIMGRLGYAPAAPAVARRRRVRCLAGRVIAGLAAVAVTAVGLIMHERSPSARRPHGPTIPAAIGRDVDRQQQRIRRTIQTIRSIAPPAPPRGAPGSSGSSGAPDATRPADLQRDIEHSAGGPTA